MAKECGFNNIPTYATHIIRAIDQPNGVQLLFNRTGDEPFTLTDPVANRIAEYRSNTINPVPEDFTGGVAVKRILLSYRMLSQINTAVDMQKIIGPLINESIKDFIDELGFIVIGYKLTAERPGSRQEYFRELDNEAGMEFRLYLTKE